jgi:hypothetical protein
MESTQLISQTDRLLERTKGDWTILGVHTEACEFLRVYAGPKNEFYARLKDINPRNASEYVAEHVQSVLLSFRAYVEAGLQSDVSPERRAQLDVVSDFLEQAHQLLETRGIHPAAPAVIVGAALEEFLRTWIENEEVDLSGRKPGLDAYATALREAELITKQDYKDITSWGGLRNYAAHGEWEEVGDKHRISLMLEGVNLFMRRYTP